ncbi:WD40 repeat-like protein [Lentinus brumalis]|uniref:WD40 repeat-like protein n=1 Tax=Lentinus brumalis TaxID=2498619 RepID=A0A371DH44_9APHY|nr:WD40 repeat-like protein [Polyporus brumalis]
MPHVPYKQTAHLQDAHSKGITRLSFNQDGTFLATAGLDGLVCIWTVETWGLFCTWSAETAVTALAWFTNEALICGLGNGILGTLHDIQGNSNIVRVSGFLGHESGLPVEQLAVDNSGRVACGAQSELSVWNWDLDAAAVSCLLSLPPRSCDGLGSNAGVDTRSRRQSTVKAHIQEADDDKEVLITGVFWAKDSLVVCYLEHGIHFFDDHTWERLRKIRPGVNVPRRIGHASLAPGGALVAISNIATGFDICDLETGAIVKSFEHEIGSYEYAIPVLFIHGGQAIVGGSSVGCCNIWYVDSGEEFPPLRIPNNGKVLAMAHHYDSSNDRFIIATGLMNDDAQSTVIIWTVSPPQPPLDDDGFIDEPIIDKSRFMWRSPLLALIVALAAFGFAIFIEEYDFAGEDGFD